MNAGRLRSTATPPLWFAPALALLAAVACAPPLASARDIFGPGVTEVKVGALLDHTGGLAAANDWRGAFHLGLEDARAAGFLPNHTVTGVLADTKNLREHVPYAVEELADAGVAAMVGPPAPRHSSVASYAANQRRVNHLDSFGRLVSLEDQTRYGFSTRISPSNTGMADSVIRICNHVGWDRLGVLVDTDENSQDFVIKLRALAAASGVEIAELVQVAFDPLLGREEDLGDVSLYMDQVKASQRARVWVYAIALEHSARFLVKMREAGLDNAAYQWIMAPTSYDQGDSVRLTGDPIGVIWPGILFAGDLSYPFDIGNWGQRVRNASVEGTSVAPEDVVINVFNTQFMHDLAVIAVKGLDALWRVRKFCDAAGAGRGAHTNCTDLDAEADDDASLRRLIRTMTLTEGLGYPIRFNPETGNSLVTMYMAQIDGERAPIAPYIFPQTVAGYVVDQQPAYWPQGQVSADEPTFLRETVLPDDAAFVALSVLCGLSLALCALCFVMTLAYRNLPIMRMSSYRINLLSAVGGAALLSVQFTGKMAFDTAVCTARLWTLSLGFTLLFGPMFAKLWRIYRIFGQKQIRSVKVTDRQLFEVVAALMLVDVVLLGAWEAASPIGGSTSDRPAEATADPNLYLIKVDEECKSDADEVLFPLVLAWKGALLLAGSYLAVKTRGVKIKALNDAKWIGLTVYTTTLIAALALPVSFIVGSSERDASFVLLAGATFMIVTAAMSLLFLPKLVAVWTNTTEEWVVSSGASTQMTVAVKGAASSQRKHTPVSGSRRVSVSKEGSPASSPRRHVQATTALRSSGSGPSSAPGSPVGAVSRNLGEATGTATGETVPKLEV